MGPWPGRAEDCHALFYVLVGSDADIEGDRVSDMAAAGIDGRGVSNITPQKIPASENAG